MTKYDRTLTYADGQIEEGGICDRFYPKIGESQLLQRYL